MTTSDLPPDTPSDADDRDPIVGIDDPGIDTYGRLLEVVRRLDRVFHATITQRCGVPGPRFELLLRLGRSPHEQLSTSQIADQLGVTAGGATRLVDRAVADGLVERRPCDHDRRVQWIRLTEAGREQLEAVLGEHRKDLDRELTDRLDPATREQLHAILDQLRPPPGQPLMPGRR